MACGEKCLSHIETVAENNAKPKQSFPLKQACGRIKTPHTHIKRKNNLALFIRGGEVL
jgi:hypothetical protein